VSVSDNDLELKTALYEGRLITVWTRFTASLTTYIKRTLIGDCTRRKMAEDLSIEEQEVCFASRRFRVFC